MKDSQEPEQESLLDVPSLHEEHWVGMPEFIQKRKEPYAKIIVRVENQEDLDALASALGQKLTRKTKSAWFPFKSHWRDGPQPVWKSEK